MGVALGTLIGTVIGNQMQHSDKARILGAGAGAVLGGLIGADIDRRRCELYKIAQANQLDIRFEEIQAPPLATVETAATPSASPPMKSQTPAPTPIVGLKVVLKDDGRQFETGSDQLTAQAQRYFEQIADQYSFEVQKRRLSSQSSKEETAEVSNLLTKRILLVGHTDDTGSSEFNADLSERRARAVARVFRDRGVAESQLFFQGAGETLPVADNRSADGRARNRRVEIIDLSDDVALRAFLANRKPALAFYRNTRESGATASFDTPRNTSRVPDSPRSSVSGAQTVAPTPSSAIDFGGSPVGSKPIPIDIGQLTADRPGMSLIASAQADTLSAGPCLDDRPRISRGLKSLKTNQEYATADYMPGLYGSSWTDMVNGNLVALTRVSVLRDSAAPISPPTLLIYRGYNPKDAATVKPTLSQTPEVNVYRGAKAVLYRVFPAAPLRCMDIVIPNGSHGVAQNAWLYYDKLQTVYFTRFNPTLAR